MKPEPLSFRGEKEMIARDEEGTLERFSRDPGSSMRKLFLPALWAFLGLILLLNSYTIVPPGFVGVAVTLGNVTQSVWDPGRHGSR